MNNGYSRGRRRPGGEKTGTKPLPRGSVWEANRTIKNVDGPQVSLASGDSSVGHFSKLAVRCPPCMNEALVNSRPVAVDQPGKEPFAGCTRIQHSAHLDAPETRAGFSAQQTQCPILPNCSNASIRPAPQTKGVAVVTVVAPTFRRGTTSWQDGPPQKVWSSVGEDEREAAVLYHGQQKAGVVPRRTRGTEAQGGSRPGW